MQQVTKNPELKKLILDLNRIDQLFKQGINSEGQSLGEYAQSTIIGTAKFKGKIEKGQPTDRVTLKDTGEYYESFDLLFNNDTIEFTSQDNYDLIGRYKEHLGLTTDNLQEAIQYIRAFILSQIREQILIQ